MVFVYAPPPLCHPFISNEELKALRAMLSVPVFLLRSPKGLPSSPGNWAHLGCCVWAQRGIFPIWRFLPPALAKMRLAPDGRRARLPLPCGGKLEEVEGKIKQSHPTPFLQQIGAVLKGLGYVKQHEALSFFPAT